jgi:putative radical SAM enzyme (TIGR03279 family)
MATITRSSKGGLIRAVTPGSFADRVGLQPGDRLLSLDGHSLRDVIDFQFYAAEDVFHLTVNRNGERIEIAAERHPLEDLGVEFAEAVFDSVRTCNNDCFFCFLKGLAPGLRSPLYLKDDDYRLSFCHGNFVTLANLTAGDWRRLEEQRLSPLNVSVHATDLNLRRRILNNPRAPAILDQLRRLTDLRIRVNTQIVLCPGVNDGDHLTRTVHELADLYPAVQSIGVVPVGATRYAEERLSTAESGGIPPCTPEYARQIIHTTRSWQKAFRRQHSVGLVYLADEYYLTAGETLPSAARYDGYPQYENGIGMSRNLIDDWRRTRRRIHTQGKHSLSVSKITFASGTLIAPILQGIAHELATLTGIEIRVVPVTSLFWGPRVTVSGLLTAGDIMAALRKAPRADLVVLPRDSLDHAGERFLDDGTPEDIRKQTGTPVIFANTLSEVLRHLASPLQ